MRKIFTRNEYVKLFLSGYGSSYYASNQWFSNPVARVHEEGIMRGVRLGRLEISPFAYNPVTGFEC